MSPWMLDRLCRELEQGAVIGYPTDTIWGFGCLPQDAIAVARILQIKRRDPSQGLILLAARLAHCRPYLEASATELRAIGQPTEKPTTWLVPASAACPAWIRGAHQSVALRVTDHPLLVELGKRLQCPLVSTSANRSGRPAVRNALQMRRQFGAELDRIVTGYATGGQRASEIKSLADGQVRRKG